MEKIWRAHFLKRRQLGQDLRSLHVDLPKVQPTNAPKDLKSDLDSLGITRAYRYPRTTEHLDTIIDFTRNLISCQFAYEKLRSVYFDLS